MLVMYFGGGFDGSTVLEQQFDDFDAILLAGDVQRSEAVEGAGVGIALAVQQDLSHAYVSAVGRYVQRRQVIHRHLNPPFSFTIFRYHFVFKSFIRSINSFFKN